ncbi:basic proline-rich protein isoform X2 [Electrophorus electricus]|uniref:basic proline-rich protein isoform X2 n=1 Tax=Electrophorus electricus TaxID=8005 RepID=UPI0015CFB59D|nr:basic proline-rich protein isoform X2 [Electrophorus electricus]
MSKGRKRGTGIAPPPGLGPGFGMYSGVPPPPHDGCWGRPPHPGGFRGCPPRPLGTPGTMTPGEHFPMAPHDFGPQHPQNEPPEFRTRGQFMHEENFHRSEFGGGPSLHPPEFEGGPHFSHPDFEARPPGFHPSEFKDGPGPGFHPPPHEVGPGPGFHPPPHEGGPGPGFHPPPHEGGPGPGFHPPPHEGGPGPGFHPPPHEGGPGPGFHPPPHEGGPGPGFHPPPHEGGPGPGFHPPPHEGGAGPGFHPPLYEGGHRPGFHPPPFEGEPGFCPANFEGGPPDFVPPKLRGALPSFPPTEFEVGPGYPVMDAGCGPADGYSVMEPNYMPPMEVHGDPGFGRRGGFLGPPKDFMGLGPGPGLRRPLSQESVAAPVTPCPPPSTQNKADQQASKQDKSENTKTENAKAPASVALRTAAGSAVKSTSASVKPPPGRSMGVISFIGNNYGFIEREDLKKFSFSFDAYFGNRDHIVPGVKVHFTAVKELGRECATDVKVAPGGTEDIEATVYEGVVTTVLPDTYVMDPYPGRIRTILSTDPIKLPFGKTDSKTTLLLFDRGEISAAHRYYYQDQQSHKHHTTDPRNISVNKRNQGNGYNNEHQRCCLYHHVGET